MKNSTIQLRVSLEHKARIKKAADNLNMSVSEYVLEGSNNIMTYKPYYMQVDEASRVFQAMHGNKEAQKITTLLEVELYPAETFGEFLLLNKIETYERVVR